MKNTVVATVKIKDPKVAAFLMSNPQVAWSSNVIRIICGPIKRDWIVV